MKLTHNLNTLLSLITKSLILNSINMKINYVKLGIMALLIMAGTAIQAQTTSTTDAGLSKDAGDGVSIKVIDNKGTIKYLQTNNGITSITSTTAGSATTTTWQLGGTLTDDTYIDVNGNAFALDGIELVDGTSVAASTDATTESDHGTGTGWTLLIRDEATGKTQKMLATDLIQSGRADDIADAAEETAGSIVISAVGVPTIDSKVWVYRNGAKLNAADFALTTDTVTVSEVASSWELYQGDVFEVQWIK